MSWDQDYSVPSVEELLEKLVGRSSEELLKENLIFTQGVYIEKMEEVSLDDSMWQDVRGFRVTLSDGRIFVPKLVRKETANGNWGRDIYEYRLVDEVVPKVEQEDLSDECGDSYYSEGECGNCGDCNCQ